MRGSRWGLVAAVAAVAVAGASCTAASGQGTEPAGPVAAPAVAQLGGAEADVSRAGGVTVQGTGRVSGRPDTLRATVGVSARRASVQEALDAANSAAQRVLDALDDAGVAQDDVRTTEFSVNPQFNQDGAITGYEVANLVEATLRDLDRVGAVLEAVVEAGGDDARVQGVSYALEDDAALLTEARAAAVADARARAEQYAEAAGVELGALAAISELPRDGVFNQDFAAEEAAGAATSVPLAPGTQDVAVTVTATWTIR